VVVVPVLVLVPGLALGLGLAWHSH